MIWIELVIDSVIIVTGKCVRGCVRVRRQREDEEVPHHSHFV